MGKAFGNRRWWALKCGKPLVGDFFPLPLSPAWPESSEMELQAEGLGEKQENESLSLRQ